MNYLKINTKSTIAKEALEYALTSTEWFEYFDFDVILLPEELIKKDAFLTEIFSQFKARAGVIRLRPNVCYNWHTDEERGVSINMLLTPEVRSTCLFAAGVGELTQFNIDELVYEPETFYLFNTQNTHMVINYDSPRYLLTVEFELDKTQLTFDDLLDKIKKGPKPLSVS